MLAPVRTAAPSVDFVSLVEAKRHCRVDFADEDQLLDGLVKTAIAHFDGYSGVLGRACVTQTWRQDFAGFSDCMRLPVGNLLAISSVTYYDLSNASQTLASSVYQGLSDAIGPVVILKPDQVWPSTYTRQDAVRVTWTAGYGPAASDVPAAIKHAALLLIGHWYDTRSAVSIGETVAEMPMAVDALLSPYRKVFV